MFKNIIEPHFEEICRKSSGNLHEQIYSGLEMALLRLALERCNQNQVLASKILGISRNTLRSRIERFGLNCR
jgi:DNA-binding protein Fis